MVIGHGLIAKKFLPKYGNSNEILVFASGVSNSQSANPQEYAREINLLQETVSANRGKIFIYFSTCSIYETGAAESAYITHKKLAEDFIINNADTYYIFRVSNLAGQTNNPNTILNFLFYAVKNNIHFDLWTGAYRNLIDVDDMYSIIDKILENKLFLNSITNIANSQNYKVTDIVKAIEVFYNKKALYKEVDKGSNFLIDSGKIKTITEHLNIHFSKNYLQTLFDKYYKI